MSPREILYIEDALSHSQFLATQCRSAAQQLSDPALRQQAQRLADDNSGMFNMFYGLI